jgi:rfaE bifunctional protein nucleotidyltransferase chain/domain
MPLLSDFPHVLTQKIVPFSELIDQIQARRHLGQNIVFTNGCFDLIHPGHVAYLTQAKALGDCLIVGLNSDASVRALKGEARPVVSQSDRALVLAGLFAVDYVVIFEELTPIDLIQAIRPNIHVKGGDYNIESLPETPIIRTFGGEVRILPFVKGNSTSTLIQKIQTL